MKLKHEHTLIKPRRFDGSVAEGKPSSIQIYRIQCMAISANMTKLAICHSQTNRVELWDLSTNEVKDKFALKSADKQSGDRHSFQVNGMSFSADSERLAIGQSDHVIYIYKIGNSWFEYILL